MSRPILGIWGYSSDAPDVLHHDSGAAIVIGGRIVAAMNEERISRRKNEGRWPAASIETVLRLAGMTASDVGAIAMAGLPPVRRAALMAGELARLFLTTGILLPNRWLYAALTAKKLFRTGPAGFSAPGQPDHPVTFVSHHDAHAASAYFTAPFEECAVVTLDGIGDSAHCGCVYAARANGLKKIRSFSGYASPGILYSYVTKAFGFRPARHEGKITGLAAHGNPEILIDQFQSRLSYENGQLHSNFIPRLFSNRVDADWATTWIDELLDTHSREDIAAALQKHTEDIAVAIVKDALRDTGMKNVALAGGVFANVRVNQKIREATPGSVWIHPHMGDGGLASGAALYVAGVRTPMESAFLGDEAGVDIDLENADGLSITQPPSMARAIARAISKGLIVGRAAGRMEYGPRALGQRTIFASADDKSINDTLNVRLKRTEFMPFAPIMTEAAAAKYLKGWSPGDVAAHYMTTTYDVTEACLRDAPAIVHVDGTARPQVVPAPKYPAPSSRQAGHEYGVLHDLLVEYGKLTGKEVLINTSFNIHEEPIVRSAADALKSCREGAVDVLALDDRLVGAEHLLKSL